MKKTIQEIEQEFDDSFDAAIQDYVESCLRQGRTDPKDCTEYFMKENDLADSEYDTVFSAISELL
jgi:hypothetical protein